MKNKTKLLILSFVVIIYGCSSTMPLPTPKDDRIVCVIAEFEDLTGSYDVVDPKFEEILDNEMQIDYTSHYTKSGRGSGSGYTEFFTNMFKPVDISDYKDFNSDSLYTNSIGNLLIEGTVEQISYGTVNDIKGYVMDVWLFGFWGLLLSNPTDNSRRAGFVEYKIELLKMPEREKIDSFILQGVYIHNPDRKKIIHSANILAARRLIFKLNNEIAKIFGKPPKIHRLRGDKMLVY